MTAPELPADVRRFILANVPSVPFLEAVLLLRTEQDRSWDAGQLSRRLYVPERNAGELLAQLREGGIVAAEGSGVRYAPAAELAGLLDQVAHAYATDLVGVSSLIHSRIDRRARQFADAFRFRKD